ncbi:MAG: hypothetical protein KDC31_13870 [Saprospiraceae bacterium]|jgi:hypothetical protein|nr:hypothetical protein [Candidatus Parvibacillus calidus]MBX2936828.1 hypothetical protein [Saprospiraceae bacterium]MBX7179616.1 hypothetical protein [Saprospiraceae bacterium]MCB0592380.1 hypothetical protein [Saprospiraceae bacterium]MCO5282683.1 hypothetical protein [Saprospiraceae bacterium]
MDEKILFKSFLSFFAEADFPLILSYDIDEPESFSDDPIPEGLARIFIAEEEGEDAFNEYVPVVQFRLNKNYLACIVWKASLQGYEFILIIYDNEGNIQESDSVAGTYHIHEPMIYKIAEFASPNRAVVVEGNIDTRNKDANLPPARKFILNISDIGEINYSLVGNL